eukprot:scaffold1298_cov382-Prasinococcus_capsulatus_cf.AAC.26
MSALGERLMRPGDASRLRTPWLEDPLKGHTHTPLPLGRRVARREGVISHGGVLTRARRHRTLATAGRMSGAVVHLLSRCALSSVQCRRSLVVRAAEKAEKAEKATPVEEEDKPFTPPTLDPNTPSPIFGGSTGGLLKKAQVEEFYVITWEGKKETIFEMPTGGAAIMRKGPNLLKLARKEQCLALGTQLKASFKIDYCIYRVYPSGEVQYLHPKDGVYPEKVNKGRVGANQNMRSIGEVRTRHACPLAGGCICLGRARISRRLAA